jgi:Raf kinase inhibitor-like YbhB/YbcL family protein
VVGKDWIAMVFKQKVAVVAAVVSLGALGAALPAANPGLAQSVLPSAGKMTISSKAVGPDGRIGKRYSAGSGNLSPPLTWSTVKQAKAYAVVVQDADSHGHPYVHWLVWNIPGGLSSLPPGLPNRGLLHDPPGVDQGRNDSGGIGWYGPNPPPGDPPHHYHFQSFALDGAVAAAPGSGLATLISAMRGHVLAIGETVGTFARPKS